MDAEWMSGRAIKTYRPWPRRENPPRLCRRKTVAEARRRKRAHVPLSLKAKSNFSEQHRPRLAASPKIFQTATSGIVKSQACTAYRVVCSKRQR
jgi:hypothetical protein